MSNKSNQIKRFRIVAMTGGMNTVAEENDLVSLDPNANLGIGFSQIKTEFRNIKNWAPINRGGLSKVFGYSLFKDVGTSTPIRGLYRFIKSSGTSLFMVAYGTKVYTLITGTLADIGATVTSGAYINFETAYDTLIICDGVVAPQKYDGTTVSALGGSPPTGMRQAVFYQNRIFGFGGTDSSLVYYSDAGNINSGYSSNFINCDKNDGQRITAIAKFFIPGQFAAVMVVAKERSIGIITGDGSASNAYTFQKITFNYGVPGFRQMIQFSDDMAFLTPRGVSSYQTTLKQINLETQILSGPIFDQFANLTQTYLGDALCFEDWKNHRVGFAVPTGNSTYPNRIWWLDTLGSGWYYQDGFNVCAAFVDTDGYLYTGDDTGKIVKHDPTVFSYNSSPINASLSTPYLDFFQPEQWKRMRWASASVRGNGAYSLGISTSLDFGTKAGTNHSIDLTAGAYTWGGGVWASDPSVYQWGSKPIKKKRFFPGGMFRNLQFTFNNSNANQPIDLFEIDCEIEYLNIL